MSNSIRDEVKDAIVNTLQDRKLQTPDGKLFGTSALYEISADIADSVFDALGISEREQDLPHDKHIAVVVTRVSIKQAGDR